MLICLSRCAGVCGSRAGAPNIDAPNIDASHDRWSDGAFWTHATFVALLQDKQPNHKLELRLGCR